MEKLFKLRENGTTFKREISAGLITFLTMAYILAVQPGMLGSIGDGMTPQAVFTATAVSAAIATFIMAFFANLPVALAPGMGIIAFFTYVVVGQMGYSWQLALAAVFLEGIVFILLSFFNVREMIIKAIPLNIKRAVAVGIGLFIALIGFANSGVVITPAGGGTILGLVQNFNAPGNLSGTYPLLTMLGLFIVAVLYTAKVPGSILIGIIAAALIGIPLGVTAVTEGWMPFSFPSAPLFFQFDFTPSVIFSYKFFIVFFTFLFMDIFDTIGTLMGVTIQAKLVDKDGNIPRVKQALLADAVGTTIGAALGTSTVTAYVESAAGAAAGGRTGLASFATGVLFLLSLFLSPIFLLIPPAATAPALIFVGFLMMQPVMEIDFSDPTEGIPAFLTVVMMPFAYSIAEGIVFGIISYVILKLAARKFKDISAFMCILCIVFLFYIYIR